MFLGELLAEAEEKFSVIETRHVLRDVCTEAEERVSIIETRHVLRDVCIEAEERVSITETRHVLSDICIEAEENVEYRACRAHYYNHMAALQQRKLKGILLQSKETINIIDR